MQGQTLRTVKWYKGSHEFYRYDPRSYPDPKKFFVLQKLYLNVSWILKVSHSLAWPQSQEHLCDSKSVVLRDVHADMSGYYTCEVTTQVIYETVQMKHYLLVVRKWFNYLLGFSCLPLKILLKSLTSHSPSGSPPSCPFWWPPLDNFKSLNLDVPMNSLSIPASRARLFIWKRSWYQLNFWQDYIEL